MIVVGTPSKESFSSPVKTLLEQDAALQSCATRQQKILVWTHAALGLRRETIKAANLIVIATPSLHPRSVAIKRLQAPNARIVQLLTPLEERLLDRIGSDPNQVYTGTHPLAPTPVVGLDCVAARSANLLHAPVFARRNLIDTL